MTDSVVTKLSNMHKGFSVGKCPFLVLSKKRPKLECAYGFLDEFVAQSTIQALLMQRLLHNNMFSN